MIYFDNAATSFPKPKSVIYDLNQCLKTYCGNPGRSSHKLALNAADKIYETREIIAKFIGNNKCENVIFTPSATYALNLVIKGIINEKCHCIISDLEHNSILRPLYKALKKHDGELSVFNSDLNVRDAIIPLIRSDTKVIISTLCSNVTGKSINLNDLSYIAKEYKLKLILDGSQCIGHTRIKINDVYYSALCCAGHKGLFGIQGSAFAIINDPELFDTLTEGGSGVDSFSPFMPELLPERYEAGTLATPAIVSLGSGVKYIQNIGIDEIEKHILQMTNTLKDVLESIRSVRVLGVENGIASFNVGNYSSSHVAKMLDNEGIATRSGFHCAPLIHQKLGTNEIGAIRVSLSYFNNEKEIYSLYKALKKI